MDEATIRRRMGKSSPYLFQQLLYILSDYIEFTEDNNHHNVISSHLSIPLSDNSDDDDKGQLHIFISITLIFAVNWISFGKICYEVSLIVHLPDYELIR